MTFTDPCGSASFYAFYFASHFNIVLWVVKELTLLIMIKSNCSVVVEGFGRHVFNTNWDKKINNLRKWRRQGL